MDTDALDVLSALITAQNTKDLVLIGDARHAAQDR